ncbi:GNAT family N-acetyltransferase [Streptomyces sp. NPDC058045]|uniref:GNAT family N-acetyltransferase n=1 Tax=Streptomyces sp. NPDC058045 TaxID=3346311 RepID=UPI0036EE22D9
MAVHVRLAEPVDADAIGEVHAASWAEAYAPFFDAEFAVRGVEDRRVRWHQRLAEGELTVLLAELDGAAAALAVYSPSEERQGWAEIHSFYCHPERWGSGASAELMAGTLRRTREEGSLGVHLWTLRDTPRSRRFYTKSGFTETGASRPRDFGDGKPLEQVEFAYRW